MKVAIVGYGYLGTVTAQHLPAKPDYSTTATTTTPRVHEFEAIVHQEAMFKGNDKNAITAVLQEQGVSFTDHDCLKPAISQICPHPA